MTQVALLQSAASGHGKICNKFGRFGDDTFHAVLDTNEGAGSKVDRAVLITIESAVFIGDGESVIGVE